MIEKRKAPYGLFAFLLLLVLIVSYYLSGLYMIEDVSLMNLQENITYIFTHPFKSYFNDKSIACMTLGLLAWILFISWYTYHYRNFQFGVEYGSAEWGDIKEICKRLRDKDEQKNRELTQNLQISVNALSNNNTVIVGSSGTFKSTGLVYPDILNMPCSEVIIDVKGDMLRLYGNYLRYHGHVVKSLNMVQPELSDHYNPLHHIEKEEDLIRLITNMQGAVKPPDAFKGDPFWDDGCALYLQAIFYCEWLEAKREKRKASMNNILTLVNLESQKVEIEEDVVVSQLQIKMDELADKYGPSYPPVRDYRKLKEGASETVRSIIIMVNAMLKLCETAGLKRIFEDDDMDFASFGLGVDGNVNKKTFLFLVIPDNDSSYNFLISMLYTQMFQVLMRTADTVCHGPLPLEVRFWMDEYYAGCRPNNPEVLMGVIRSRNISMNILVQSISQLKTVHKGDSWNTLFDNASTFIFLGSGPGAKDTHQYISELLGKMTIDKRSDGMRAHGDANLNNDSTGRELMTPEEVKRLHRKKCIVFMEGERPVIDWKIRPFDREEFKLAKKLGPYTNPVKVVFDEETLTYRTVSDKSSFKVLTADEAEFYEQKAKRDSSIKIFNMDEEQFLYLNLNEEPVDEKELEKYFQEFIVKYKEETEPEEPEQKQEANADRDLSGNIFDWINRFWAELSAEAQEEILLGLEDGLTDDQIKSYFFLQPAQMRIERRLYSISNRRNKVSN